MLMEYTLYTQKGKVCVPKSNNIFPNMTKCFYYFIHYQLKIQLFIISFNKNFHACQTMLDTSNKRYKIEVSGRGKGINDNSEGALIEGYIKW